MRTFCKKLKKSETALIDGLTIITSGSVEILYNWKRIEVKTLGRKIGYELIFIPNLKLRVRALADDTVITVLPLVDLKRLYKTNYEVKTMADNAIRRTINDLYSLSTSKENHTLDQVLERLIRNDRNHYCILNVSQLCREWGYSRTQFYRAIKTLKEKGYEYNEETRCFTIPGKD